MIDYSTIPLPVSPGDWVADKNGSQVARVCDVYADVFNGKIEILVDLFLYNRQGEKILRQSPRCGGPRSYEPACDWENWERIEEPDFPIVLRWITNDKGVSTAQYHHGAKVLPPRNRLPRKRVSKIVSAPKPIKSDFDPIFEAATCRMTAQNLRDIAKTVDKTVASDLINRAMKLEQEALGF